MSGPHAINVCQQVFEFDDDIEYDKGSQPKRFSVAASARWQHENDSHDLIIYCWPTTRSYTRQPVVEIHGLLSSVDLDELVFAADSKRTRLAQPGEFTLRAFAAGRMDLLQAEAVLGVIDGRKS